MNPSQYDQSRKDLSQAPFDETDNMVASSEERDMGGMGDREPWSPPRPPRMSQDFVTSRSDEPGTLAQDAVDAAKDLLGNVTAQARDLASNVTGELSSSAEAGVRRGADVMRAFAQAMQTAAQDLEEGSPASAERVRRTARQIETFSDSIRDRTVTDLFTAASDMARRQPTAFVTGAVLAGFALSRFLKSRGVGSASAMNDNEGGL